MSAGWEEADTPVCAGKGPRKCWAGMGHGTHATGSRETKNRPIAGFHVCPAILCLDSGVEHLRLWEQISGLGSPVLHTLGGQNRQPKASASSACISSCPAEGLSKKQLQR